MVTKMRSRQLEAPSVKLKSRGRRGIRYAAAALSVATVGLGVPATASAYDDYFRGSPGVFDIIYLNSGTDGARHSLTRISTRHAGGNANANLCVYGADGNNKYNRNTSFYCAVYSDVADVSLGGILRYPWDLNNGGNTYARSLSQY